MTDATRQIFTRCALIVVILLAVYGNTLNHGFVWDDNTLIVISPIFEKLSNIPHFFLAEDSTDLPTGYYRPITYVSFALDRAIWGLNPVGYNITNLLLHIATALLFYRVVAALFKRENLALASAVIFALHPIATETVNFHAGGRNTLLCASFALLSLLCYARNKAVPAVACFTLAIFSKEFALLLPVLFILYDRLVAKEKIRWIGYLPYLVSIGCYLGLRAYSVRAHANLLKTVGGVDRPSLIPQTVVKYLYNMVFPFDLKTMYQLPELSPLQLVGYLAVILALVAVAFIFRKRVEIVFATLLFLLFLLPVTNVFPLGTAKLADRYAYFSCFGFSLALAYIICTLNKKVAVAVTVALCLVYSAIDFTRNGIWKDELSLFTQMTKDVPGMAIGFHNLAFAYFDKNDFGNAEKYLTIASTKPDLGHKMLIDSATMFWEMNRLDKAMAALQKRMEKTPGNPEPYIMASRLYQQMGDQAKAKEYHDKAAAIYPGIFEMMTERTVQVTREGEDFMARRMPVVAERLFKEAVAIDPGFAPALVDLGSLYAEKGDLTKAVTFLNKAAAADPRNPAVHYNLAQIYQMQGNTAESEQEMKLFREAEAAASKK